MAHLERSANEMMTCPKCGEELEDQFDSCWQCGSELPAHEQPALDGGPMLAPERLQEPMALGLYVTLASSFVWVPVLFLVIVSVFKHMSGGAGLFILFLAGVYLLAAAIGVSRSGRKTRWVFALLNGLLLGLDAFWFVVMLPFAGGIYN